MTRLLGFYVFGFVAFGQVLPPTLTTQAGQAGHTIVTIHNNATDQALTAFVYTITLVDPASGKTRATSTRFVDVKTNRSTKAIPPNGDDTFWGGGSPTLQAQVAFRCGLFEDGSSVGEATCSQRILDRRTAQRTIVRAILIALNDPALTSTSPAKIVAAVNTIRDGLLQGVTDSEQIHSIQGIANMVSLDLKSYLSNPDMSAPDVQAMIKGLQANFTARAKLLEP